MNNIAPVLLQRMAIIASRNDCCTTHAHAGKGGLFLPTMRRTSTRLFAALVPRGSPRAGAFTNELPSGAAVTSTFRRTWQAAVQHDDDQAKRGFYALPTLRYSVANGVPPVWTAAQVEMLHRVMHQFYVDETNRATLGSSLEAQPLDVVLRSTAFDASRAGIHQAAAEFTNYNLMWQSVSPWGHAVHPELAQRLSLSTESGGVPPWEAVAAMSERLREAAVASLQSGEGGWIYLVFGDGGGRQRDRLYVETGAPGHTPVTRDVTPLLTLNTQYPAWYLDYGHNPEAYVDNVLKALDWKFAWSVASEHLQTLQ